MTEETVDDVDEIETTAVSDELAAEDVTSVLADGRREYRRGCSAHPWTKVCPRSCPVVGA